MDKLKQTIFRDLTTALNAKRNQEETQLSKDAEFLATYLTMLVVDTGLEDEYRAYLNSFIKGEKK